MHILNVSNGMMEGVLNAGDKNNWKASPVYGVFRLREGDQTTRGIRFQPVTPEDSGVLAQELLSEEERRRRWKVIT